MDERRRPGWLVAAPSVFVVLWSGGYAAAKLGLAYADPLTFLALRYAAVVLLLAPVALLLRPRLPGRPRTWVDLAVVGLLIQGLYFGLSYLGFSRLSAGAAALILSLQPILAALLAPALAGEAVPLRHWLGLALGLAGTALVIGARSTVAATSWLGIAYCVAGLLAMTGGTFYEKRFGTDAHPLVASLVQCGAGFLAVLPLAALLEPMRIEWTGALVGSLAYLVLANSIVSMTLLLAMIRHGEIARVSALFFIVPSLAALIAWLVLGEAMPPMAWLGMGVAASGLLVSRGQGARKPAEGAHGNRGASIAARKIPAPGSAQVRTSPAEREDAAG